MKKCPRCRVAYTEDTQRKCLYCDGLLLTARESDFISENQHKDSALDMSKAKELKFKDSLSHQRKDYLLGTFFRGSTFLSSYRFNLREIKKGQTFKRFLVQPLDLGTFLKIPWLIVNVVYSSFFFLMSKRYCPECGYQYIPQGAGTRHDPKKCSYNQEHDMIQNEIFSGKVFIDLNPIRQISDEKVRRGEPSALQDLFRRNLTWEKMLDLASIVVSIIIYCYLLSLIAMPLFDKIYHFEMIG